MQLLETEKYLHNTQENEKPEKLSLTTGNIKPVPRPFHMFDQEIALHERTLLEQNV